MKRCPECNSTFSDVEKFCEFDGAALIDNAADIHSFELDSNTSRQFPLPVAATAGLVIGVLLVLIYLVLTTHQNTLKRFRSSTSAPVAAQQQLPSRPLILQPESTPTPTTEPSPSPSPTTTPAASIQPTPEQVKLSVNPISTTQGQNKGPLTIKLNTGITIEADEAWQTADGIWYRKGGMVSLLDPKNIKSVQKKSDKL
jgi:hypothetical protein